MPEPDQIHIAIVRRPYAELILSGVKTIECRLTRYRRPPFGRVRPGDRIYIKVSSGEFVATAIVSVAVFITPLGPGDLEMIRGAFGERIRADEAFWDDRRSARHAALIHLDRVEPIAFGPRYTDLAAGRPRQAWHVLPASRDVYPACVSRQPLLFNPA